VSGKIIGLFGSKPLAFLVREQQSLASRHETNDVAAGNATGIGSAGREISSAFCAARAMSNRVSRRLPV
jgi:hypothetical protein